MTGTGQTPQERRPSSRFGAHLVNCYLSADPRWLGVFRIAFGMILCADLFRRWVEAREYYTNEGFLPNHFSLFRPMGDRLFSLYHPFSTLGEIHVVFTLTAIVFVSYTLGYKTKLAQILAALLMTSLDARNLFVENGGDVVVNLLAVITAFLPLGRRFSIDAVIASMGSFRETTSAELNDRTRPPRDEEPFVSLVVLLLILQLAVIYFFNAVHKNGTGWRNGSAIHWFLEQDRIVTWLGIFIREHVPYDVKRLFTYGTLIIEGTLPLLIVSPILHRRFAMLLAIGLHGGIALTSRLGPFSYVMVTFFFLILGAPDWQYLTRFFRRESRRATVIYDADCGICLWLARLVKRLDPFERLTFVGNDEVERFPSGVTPETVDKTLVVVDSKGRVYEQEQAVRVALFALPFGSLLGVWLLVPGLRQLAHAVYQKVAANRLRISAAVGLGACGIPQPAAVEKDAAEKSEGERKSRTLRGDVRSGLGLAREMGVALLGAMLLTQLAIDNPWIRSRVKVHRAEWMGEIIDRFRLLEGWGMFAPEPPYEDGRLVVDARTKDGRKLDPFTGALPDFSTDTKTGWGHEQFWCDYSNKIRFTWFSQHRQFLREYLKHWHEFTGRPNDELVAFDVWWVEDKSPKPGETHTTPLPPAKLVSLGIMRDSGAVELLAKTKKPAPTPASPPARGPVNGAHP
jgi:predicted DCC family thiol-disulfide oxidoreductase YuxK